MAEDEINKGATGVKREKNGVQSAPKFWPCPLISTSSGRLS